MDGSGADAASKVFSFLNSVGLGWLWLLCLAVWGGTASYIARVRKMRLSFSFVELVGEWTISGFAGVITGYVCYSAGFSDYATMAFAGIAGHMGGGAIALLEQRFAGWVGKHKHEDHR